jgi:hypothetical protein
MCLFCAQTLIAVPSLDSLLSKDIQEKLFAEEMLSAAHFNDLLTSLIPHDERIVKAISDLKSEVKPSILIESLCYYKKPAEASYWTVEDRTKLFNGIVAISALEGLRYYSNSRNGTRLFYEKSHLIDSPESKKIISDPVFTPQNLPDALTLYAEQKDLTFGNNIYRFDFTVDKDLILFFQRNVTTMSYGIIPVLGKNKLRTVIGVIDTGDYILIYMVSMADTLSIPGMKNRIGASFSARAQAVLDWFTSKADAIYKKQ